MNEVCQRQKRERGKNFLEEEKISLLDILSQHKKIIENKATDAPAIVEKAKAWQEITEKFNRSFAISGERTPFQLKQLYETLKWKVKKTISLQKVELYKNGETPEQESLQLSELEEKVAAIGGLQISHLENMFDPSSDFSEASSSFRKPASEIACENCDVELQETEEYFSQRSLQQDAPDTKKMKYLRPKKRKLENNKNNNDEINALKRIKLEKEIQILDAELELKKLDIEIKREELIALQIKNLSA